VLVLPSKTADGKSAVGFQNRYAHAFTANEPAGV